MDTDPAQIVEAFRARVEERVKDSLQRASFRLAVYVERFMDERGPTPGTRSTSPRIGLQEGHISRALVPRQVGNITSVEYSEGGWTLETGIDEDLVPHARIHEFGGEITPKSAGALIVPVSPEAAAALKGAGGNVRSLNLTIIPNPKTGKAVLAKVEGKQITPYFALVKSVTIPARPYYTPGVAAFYAIEVPRMNAELLEGFAADWDML